MTCQLHNGRPVCDVENPYLSNHKWHFNRNFRLNSGIWKVLNLQYLSVCEYMSVSEYSALNPKQIYLQCSGAKWLATGWEVLVAPPHTCLQVSLLRSQMTYRKKNTDPTEVLWPSRYPFHNGGGLPQLISVRKESMMLITRNCRNLTRNFFARNFVIYFDYCLTPYCHLYFSSQQYGDVKAALITL